MLLSRYGRIERLTAGNARLSAKNSEQSLISIKVGVPCNRYGEYVCGLRGGMTPNTIEGLIS